MNKSFTFSLFSFVVKNKASILSSLLLFSSILLSSQPCSNNLLLNPGFEDGLNNWSTTGDASITSDAFSGNNAIQVCGGPGSIGQIFPAVPGEDYKATVWGKALGQTNTSVVPSARLRFLDGNYAPIDVPGNNLSGRGINSSSYIQRELYAAAPSDAVYVHLFFWKETDGCFIVDALEVCSGIPAPSTFVLARCPYDVTVDPDPGENGATLNLLNLPIGFGATSTTACAPLTNSYTPFFPDENFYPIGNTEVCHTVQNNCGDTETCCMNVTVNGGGEPDFELLYQTAVTVINGGSIVIEPNDEIPAGNTIQFVSHFAKLYFPVQVPTFTLGIGSYLSSDANLDGGDLQLVSGSMQINEIVQTFGFTEGGFGQGTIPVNTPTGNYFLITKYDSEDSVTESNETNNFIKIPIIVTSGNTGGEIDLELSLTQANASPAQWSNYSTTATVNNTGNQTATGVKVSFNKPTGVVYTGGNEFTASQGTFDLFGSEIWEVGSLPAGGSATLEVSYFLLQNVAPDAFAQVVAANEADADSTPGNGTPPSVNEDDEASTSSGSPTLQPDLQLANLNIQNSPVVAGGILNYTFDAINFGNGTASGNFNIKTWISTDNVISPNDIQDGIVPTGNYGPGLVVPNIPGASTIPAGLADGSYFLILKVDADNNITESNEANNTISMTFSIDGVGPVNCSGDIVLTSQAEVDAFGPCTVYNGDVRLEGTSITNLLSFNGLQIISGDLIIDRKCNLSNLSGLNQLQSIGGSLEIDEEFIGTLTDISALGNLETIHESLIIKDAPLDNLSGLEKLTSVGFLFFRDLDKIKNLDHLQNLTNIDKTLWITLCANLEDISGLSNLSHVGGIDLRNMPKITDLSPLSNISGQLNEGLLIWAMGGLSSLNGLQNITDVTGRAQIFASHQLQNVDALSNLTSAGEFLLNLNSNLTNCCGAYPILNSGGVAGLIQVANNPGCSSAQEILDNCAPSGDIDLSLTMSADPLNPAIYSTTAVTITVTNAGPHTAAGVWTIFKKPNGVVYEGGNEWSATKGSFYPFGNEWWDIGTLAPGASASLTVNYFLLSSNTIKPWAEVTDAIGEDVDSTPANGVCCTPNEDDEATININNFAGNPNNFLLVEDLKGRPIQLKSIQPNPVYHGEMTVSILSKIEGEFDLEIYDLFGRKAILQKIILEEGRNDILLDIGILESGTYYLNMPGQNWNYMPLRFVVARW